MRISHNIIERWSPISERFSQKNLDLKWSKKFKTQIWNGQKILKHLSEFENDPVCFLGMKFMDGLVEDDNTFHDIPSLNKGSLSRTCWHKISTLCQAHSKPNKLASHAKRFRDVPVNFPWKLTKDKVVKFQSLELAGWYQTVPYLRLESHVRWSTYSYEKLSASKLGAIREL
jgi:hypothetical protein